MSEDIGPIPTKFDKPESYPKAHEIESFPVPPPRKRGRRRKKIPTVEEIQKAFAKSSPIRSDFPPNMEAPNAGPPPITMEQILAAKAILSRAEEALGVQREVKKEAPLPFHPMALEDPALGDKTPAVVEWYRDHAPEEYRRRYSGRKTHLEDRRKERAYQALSAGASVAPFPADPDGKFMVAGVEADLSKTDHSGNAPRNFRDL